jgi:hypothetical protein
VSNRRRLRPAAGKPRDHGWLNDALAPLDGARIPGGCDHCGAFSVVCATAYGQRGISILQVHHDAWCRVLQDHHDHRATAPGQEKEN